MREFQETKKIRGVLSSWLVFTVLAVAVAWLLWSIFIEYMALREKRLNHLKVSAELQNTVQKSDNLKHEIEQINSGFGLEKIFRERFNVKKPGEEMFIIVEEKITEDVRKQTADNGFLRSLWATVKNIF